MPFFPVLIHAGVEYPMSELTVVTLDGPSGVGKSTVSKRIAAATGFIYLDTGAMYRAAGVLLLEKATDLGSSEAVKETLGNIEIVFLPLQNPEDDIGVLLNGRDVSERIRSSEMAMMASKVSALGVVREILTEKQREYGRKGRIVAEGRDTGTVVFPSAVYKFFLDADPVERARRRVSQFQEKGIEADFQETLNMIVERDKNDSERALAPLKKAEDALLVDTTQLSLDKVVDLILSEMKQKGYKEV